MMKTAQNYVNSEQIKTFHDGLSDHQPLTFISAAADCKFRLAVCILQTAVWKERYTMYIGASAPRNIYNIFAVR